MGGMNQGELDRNYRFTQRIVQNLNTNPVLPFEDGSVDVFSSAEGVNYLLKPLEVFTEMQRVLKPGGLVVMSFSNNFNRMKVMKAWRMVGRYERCAIALSYLRFTGFERY